MHDIHAMLITTRTCAVSQADSDRPFTSEGRFQSQSGRVGCVMDKVSLGLIHLRKILFSLSELFIDASWSFTHLPSTIYITLTPDGFIQWIIFLSFKMAKSLEKQLNLISPSVSGLPVSNGLITRRFKYDRDWLCVRLYKSVPVIFEPSCILDSIFIFSEVLLQCYTVKITFHLRNIDSHFHTVRRSIHYETVFLSTSTSCVTEWHSFIVCWYL